MRTTASSAAGTIDGTLEGTIGTVSPVELSLVVPLFNEEESVGPLIERICAAMATYPSAWELILVDDGSTDATIANAKLSLSRSGLILRIIELQRNFGQTAAMQAGITEARGRLIATLDGDGYVRITDRAKDVIISGGENVSSVEVEGALMAHPDVNLAAVVAKPDEKWGEVPCAFVELKAGMQATEAELIAFVRERLAGFKTPKRVIFHDLPKTSTGKIQKFELRALAKTL